VSGLKPLFGIFVLWALCGNEESDAYFEGHPRQNAAGTDQPQAASHMGGGNPSER
jgi:hypothetical protein